jgi:hypothetical protein
MLRMEVVQEMRRKLEEAGMLPLSSQAETCSKVIRERLDQIMPKALEATGIDFWLVLASEGNEDPISRTFFTWDMRQARRFNAFMFYRARDGAVRCMTAGVHSPFMAQLYEDAGRPKEDVYECIVRVIRELNPSKIAVNQSKEFSPCDGLLATQKETLLAMLPEEFHSRIVSAEPVAVYWMQHSSNIEKKLLQCITGVTKDIIREVFSPVYVKPGETNTADLEWMIREHIVALGFNFHFSLDVDLQRMGESDTRLAVAVVQPGDLLHCDVGMCGIFVPLYTDIQQVAYVRREGEKEAPAGLEALVEKANRFEDIVAEEMAKGGTGNEVLVRALNRGRENGLRPMLYTHPLGTLGHGVGPLVGLYDNQISVPHRGDQPVIPDTCYALEFNVTDVVPEWNNQDVVMYLEEDVCLEEKLSYLNGRQTKLILV